MKSLHWIPYYIIRVVFCLKLTTLNRPFAVFSEVGRIIITWRYLRIVLSAWLNVFLMYQYMSYHTTYLQYLISNLSFIKGIGNRYIDIGGNSRHNCMVLPLKRKGVFLLCFKSYNLKAF